MFAPFYLGPLIIIINMYILQCARHSAKGFTCIVLLILMRNLVRCYKNPDFRQEKKQCQRKCPSPSGPGRDGELGPL